MDACWPKAEQLVTNPENPNKLQNCAYGKIFFLEGRLIMMNFS